MTQIQIPQHILHKHVSNAVNGDSESIGALYDALYDRLYIYAYRRTLDRSASKDIVANSFYKILTNINSFKWKHEGGFYGWVFRITAHEISTYYHQAKGYVLHEDWLNIADSADNTSPDVLSQMQVDEEYRELHECVSKLPQKYRTAVELYYFAGLNHVEIAQTLSIREGAARVRMPRGIETLQKELVGEKSLVSTIV